MPTSLLFADRPDDIARVRQALAEAGFTAAKVLEVMGPHGFTFLSRHEPAPSCAAPRASPRSRPSSACSCAVCPSSRARPSGRWRP